MDLAGAELVSRLIYRAENRLAPAADLILFNSHAGHAYHRTLGMRPRRALVIPNGFDVERFRRNAQGARAFRAALGIPDDAWTIGIVARFDPIKDHALFLEAAARFCAKHPDQPIFFVCAGTGPAPFLEELKERARRRGLSESVRWVEAPKDLPAVYSALDVATLTSKGEGFPNVLAEAMLCGTPCVSTDVGDAREILAEHGEIVPPGDAGALAAAWERRIVRAVQLSLPDRDAIRESIVSRYSMAAQARATEDALRSVVDG
jgi:glycosyltransferase involved in cell wall biosynthesis